MKRRVWCGVSSHGFGHFAQMAPILNALAKKIPDLKIHITGNIPTALITKMIDIPVSHDPINRDVGLIQSDPLTVNHTATANAIRQLHHHWPEKVNQEAKLMGQWQPDVVLADIPYLSLAACQQQKIPGVAIASLSWDEVIAAYFPTNHPETQEWLTTIQTAYAKTTLALLPTPALPNHPFLNTESIPPITSSAKPQAENLRRALGIWDQRPLILISLGGIPMTRLPIEALIANDRFHWLVDGAISKQHDHIHPLQQLPHWLFANVAASVSGIISKPGYGTAIAAAAHQIPFLYVKRGIFPDETPICNWIQQNNRTQELDLKTFHQGQFEQPLTNLFNQIAPPAPKTNGAQVAAEILIDRFLN